MIINRLHRIKLDANRDIMEAAQGDEYAETAWYKYYGYITDARIAVTEKFDNGLLIDLHGHGHEKQ